MAVMAVLTPPVLSLFAFLSVSFLIGVIVGGVLLCSLLVTCGVCYRRRKLARESGFATFSEPYTTTQPIAHEHAYHQYA